MRLTRRLSTMLATTLLALGLGLAYAEDHDPPDARPSFGVLVTCSTGGFILPDRAGCTAERRVLTLGDWEVSIGLDARAAWRFPGEIRDGYLGPIVVLSYYQPTYSAFVEVLPVSLAPGRTWGGWRAGFAVNF
jgi:hypothetical protein